MVGVTSYAFSTLPNDSDCLTVGLCYGEVGFSYFQAGSEECEYHDFRGTFCASCHSSPRWFNGGFYFIGEKGKLRVFKLVDEKPSWKLYNSPLTEEEIRWLNSGYLEVDGQLMSVFFQEDGRTVQVFKFDILEESWVELDDLGEYVLFLSQASSISIAEKDSTKRNIIYLPKRAGNQIVYYSLDTCKYHVLGKEDCWNDFYGMTTSILLLDIITKYFSFYCV
ncbi:hypothetical protein RND81_08G190100 [Saponaria officinalis]|uniref:KIB1-4 beta-propeller domain-containing protein n=1 Tax=Saponaria officinalis TaxID=3572 RepID=A0AAW1J9C4_SAPOF